MWTQNGDNTHSEATDGTQCHERIHVWIRADRDWWLRLRWRAKYILGREESLYRLHIHKLGEAVNKDLSSRSEEGNHTEKRVCLRAVQRTEERCKACAYRRKERYVHCVDMPENAKRCHCRGGDETICTASKLQDSDGGQLDMEYERVRS